VEFQDWLLAEGLSISTAKKYVGALKGSLTQWAISNKIITESLTHVRDPQEFTILSGLIKATDIFSERNTRGNHMYGATLARYSRYLNDNSKIVASRSTHVGPFRKELVDIQKVEDESLAYEPNNQKDARKWVLREIVRRQGQTKFRSNLIAAYEGRCAMTQCKILMILDAAHVTPYLGPQTNSTSNGILLRTDLHSLWDQGFIAINPHTMHIAVSPSLKDLNYQILNQMPIFEPKDLASRLSPHALAEQWKIFLSTLDT
jgi:hypothetical protein